jgi:signal transduction histidine kinase
MFAHLTRPLFTTLATLVSASLFVSLMTQEAFALVAENVSIEAEATIEVQADPIEEARTNTQADRAVIRGELTASTAENRAVIQERVAERQSAIEAKAQKRVTNLAANMSNRMETVLTRLQNIIDRMESRLVKLEETGLNTTASAAALASAQISIDAARGEIADIDASVYSTVSSPNVRDEWTALKIKFETIRDQIKTAHGEIKSSILLVKEAELEARAQQNTKIEIE